MSRTRQQTEAQFQKEYERLNPAQREAVDTIEGPVMVIAGPGTGKTQILACRIGKILLETDTAPENILCLTFTDAGNIAMRQRLQKMIGPDAYRVSISTYHSFCHDVIQSNLHLFEKNSLDPISDLERHQLFRDLIDSLPKNHQLKRYRGDAYYEAGPMKELFSHMKRENWSLAQIEEAIEQRILALAEDPSMKYKRQSGTNKVGDWKPDYTKALNQLKNLRAAAGEFDRYTKLMLERHRYDFDDMITWVIRAFNENPLLLASYQERYQYVLVDEYQDTSGSQNRIVEQLISFWDIPNLFVVGDDDQCIFRFQGANVENMMNVTNRYQEHLTTIVLSENYRSTPPILRMAKRLIDRNTERLVNRMPGLTKELVSASPDKKDLDLPPRLTEYNDPRDEMIGIVTQIRTLVDSGVSPGDIAVIYKENIYLEDIARYLQHLEIPVYTKRQLDALLQPPVKKLVTLLKYLAAEHYIPYSGDELLFEILHFDGFGIPPIEVAKLSIENFNRRVGKDVSSIRALLREKTSTPDGELFPLPAHPALVSTSQVMEELIASVPNLTLQSLLEVVFHKSGMLPLMLTQPDRHTQLEVVGTFFDWVKEETRRKPSLTLAELVQVIDLMVKEKVKLGVVQTIGSEKGVNLLTAHGSKGLEFPHVFVAGINAHLWENKRAGNNGYVIPSTLFLSTSDSGSEEELRRLLYVTITRAETHLHLSYHRHNDQGKVMEPSRFVAEILDDGGPEVVVHPVDDVSRETFALLRLQQGVRPRIEELEEDLIAPILEKFVMNVTALNAYLKCPVSFYYNNFLRVPSAKNEAMEFGSAIHDCLHYAYEEMKKDASHRFPELERLQDRYRMYMHRNRELFTREQFDRKMEYGLEVLKNYHRERLKQPNPVVLLEQNIRHVMVDHVPIKGKLDKMEFRGNYVRVVDYKTGNPDNGRKKIKGPGDKDPVGGDYWRQAVFYQILVNGWPGKSYQVEQVCFDFVEPDKSGAFPLEVVPVSQADVATVSEQIRQTWDNIQQRNFYTGCGESTCHWCGFVKTHQLAVGWQEEEDS